MIALDKQLLPRKNNFQALLATILKARNFHHSSLRITEFAYHINYAIAIEKNRILTSLILLVADSFRKSRSLAFISSQFFNPFVGICKDFIISQSSPMSSICSKPSLIFIATTVSAEINAKACDAYAKLAVLVKKPSH